MTISAKLKRLYGGPRRLRRYKSGPLAGMTPREAWEAVVKVHIESARREIMALVRDTDLTPQQRERVDNLEINVRLIDSFLKKHYRSKLTGNQNHAKPAVMKAAALRFARDYPALKGRALVRKVHPRVRKMFKDKPPGEGTVREWLDQLGK